MTYLFSCLLSHFISFQYHFNSCIDKSLQKLNVMMKTPWKISRPSPHMLKLNTSILVFHLNTNSSPQKSIAVVSHNQEKLPARLYLPMMKKMSLPTLKRLFRNCWLYLLLKWQIKNALCIKVLPLVCCHVLLMQKSKNTLMQLMLHDVTILDFTLKLLLNIPLWPVQ